MTFDIDTFAEQSQTAIACETAALYGATPERGEFDSREVWDEDDATGAVQEAFRILAEGVGPDGTQLADERESLLWGFVNMLHAQMQRLDRSVDRLTPELRELAHAQDGTEIKARELELVTDRAQNLGDRRDAFEKLRDTVAEQYRSATGEVWRPRHGSHTSQTGRLTSAAIDARDFQHARKDRKTRAHLPQGTLVAIAGGKDIADPAAVIARLDKARAKYSDLIPVHGGGPGVEKIAAQWAERSGVHQIVRKPDWQNTDAPHPSAATTNCSTSCRRASSPSPAPALPTTSSTRQGSSASRWFAAPPDRSIAGRIVIPGAGGGGAATRQRWHPRVRFPSPTRSGACRARAPSSHRSASHRASHECIGDRAERRALPGAPHRAVRAAPSAAQSPRRLRPAGSSGGDSPTAIQHVFPFLTAWRGLEFSRPTQQAAGSAKRAPVIYPLRFQRHEATGACREKLSAIGSAEHSV